MGCPRFDGVSKYRWPLLCCVCLGDDMCCGVATRLARGSSATPNPGDVAAKAMVKIQRGLIQGQLRGRCPKLELVTVTVAAMAVVATDRQVHRERAATSRRGLMQRANSVPLYPRSLRGLEPKQAQNLLHRDLSELCRSRYLARLLLTRGRRGSLLEDRSVPLLSLENGNDPPRVIKGRPGSLLEDRSAPLLSMAHATAPPRATQGRRGSLLEDRSVPLLSMGNGNGPPRVISRRAANQRTCGRAGRLAPATPTPRPIARSGPPGNRGASLASAPCPGPEGRVLAPPDRVAFRPGAPR